MGEKKSTGELVLGKSAAKGSGKTCRPGSGRKHSFYKTWLHYPPRHPGGVLMSTRVVAAVIAFSLLSLGSAWGDGRTPTVRDVVRIVKVSDPHFSPDGKMLAYVETRANLDSDEYESEIDLIAVSGGDARPLTRDRHHAASPRWSPSGDRLGFLAPDSDKVVQLYVMPMAGGDTLPLTKGKDRVEQFAWSPDGSSIAYAMADPKPELKGEDKFRTAFKVGNDDITVREAVRQVHLWLVAAQGGEPKRLTSGTWSLPSSLPPGPPPSPIAWSRDGKSLVLVRQETPSTGDQFLTRIQVLDVASGQIRSLTGSAELEGYPVLSPDGSSIAYWRNRDAHPWNYQDVWLSGFAGGTGRDISAALDKNVYLTHWSPNGDWLLVGGNVDTTVGLWWLKPNGSAAPVALGGVMPVNTYWIDADIDARGDIAFIGQTKSDPYELYLVPADGGAPAAMTRVNAGLADLTLSRSETVTWKGPGGRTLDGVVTFPPTIRGAAAIRSYSTSTGDPIHRPGNGSISCRRCWRATTGWCSNPTTAAATIGATRSTPRFIETRGRGRARTSCPGSTISSTAVSSMCRAWRSPAGPTAVL